MGIETTRMWLSSFYSEDVLREVKGTTIDEQINVLPNRRNRVKRDGKER